MLAETVDIAHVKLRERPLVVCDIDEVVLEFISPLGAYLRDNGHELLPRSFHLHGNIVSLLDGSIPENDAVSAFIEGFFATQDRWQKPAERAVETLHALSSDADVVFLTAMPPRHQTLRRALLDRFDLAYPMIATEAPKGPVVRQLHADRPLPVAFLDDIERNLLSVGTHVPDCLLLQLMANDDFRALAPPPTDGILAVAGWEEALATLRSHWGLSKDRNSSC
jgi:hypothetical protein